MQLLISMQNKMLQGGQIHKIYYSRWAIQLIQFGEAAVGWMILLGGPSPACGPQVADLWSSSWALGEVTWAKMAKNLPHL